LHLHQERAAATLNGGWIITTLIEAKQAAGNFKCPSLMLIWMRFDRHPFDLVLFHVPFRKGWRLMCFSYLTLLSQRMGGGHNRLSLPRNSSLPASRRAARWDVILDYAGFS